MIRERKTNRKRSIINDYQNLRENGIDDVAVKDDINESQSDLISRLPMLTTHSHAYHIFLKRPPLVPAIAFWPLALQEASCWGQTGRMASPVCLHVSTFSCLPRGLIYRRVEAGTPSVGGFDSLGFGLGRCPLRLWLSRLRNILFGDCFLSSPA